MNKPTFRVIERRERSEIAQDLIEAAAYVADEMPEAKAFFVVAWDGNGMHANMCEPGDWSVPFFSSMVTETVRGAAISAETVARLIEPEADE